MRAIQKFTRVPLPDRILLLRAVLLVILIRLGLWAIPFNLLYRLLGGCLKSQGSDIHSEERLVWAVRAAARRIPCASCLTQALALQFLMARTGQRSSVQIGIAKDNKGNFEAHAWVEARGRILLNTPAEIARYTRLTSMDRPA